MIELERGSEKDIKKKTINLDGMEPYLKYILHGLYQKGYGEVTFIYSNDKTAQSLHQILHEEMIGFEVVEQTLNSSTIRAVAGALASEFDAMLRRAFKIMVSMLDGIVEVFKTGNILPIKSLTYMEANNRKYTSFCKRMINKKLVHHEEITYLYVIVIRIERLAKHYKYLCFEILKLPKEIKDMDEEIVEMFSELQELLHAVYEVFNNYDIMKILPLMQKRTEIYEKANEYLRKNKNPQTRFIHYILIISQDLFDLMRLKMQIEF